MKKKLENINSIYNIADPLRDWRNFGMYLRQLLKEFRHVWNIDLLNKVKVPEIFPHSFSKFILVSNNLPEITKIKELLIFKKEKREIFLHVFQGQLKVKNIDFSIPIFEFLKN